MKAGRVRQHLGRGVVVVYCALICVWAPAWLALGDSHWLLALINHIGAWLLLPALVLPVALLERPWRRWQFCIVPPIVVAVGFSLPYLAPRPPDPSPAALRVLNFNVLFSNPDMGAVAALIQREQPDLVMLQEVQPEQFSALQDALGDAYPYTRAAPRHPYGTTAIFSRFPVEEWRVVETGEDRRALLARVRIDGRMVTAISAHLLSYGLVWVAPPDLPRVVMIRVSDQHEQARRLIAAAGMFPNDPLLLACDCNSPETAGTARILHAAFRSAAREVGWWPTLAGDGRRADRWLGHIEYLFVRGDLRVLSHMQLGESAGSDHQPLLTTLGWR
jgi:endonuclease/exonuclease/phosphatase (EEP) superfamily protein YafD